VSKYLIIIFLFVHPPSALALENKRLETKHFSFYFLPIDKPIAVDLMHQVESIRSQIIDDLGVEWETKTKVYLAHSEEIFQQLQPQKKKVPGWVVGMAYPALNLIILKTFRIEKGSYPNILSSFKHELTHIAIGRAFKWYPIPRWLNEGLAMYEAREWRLGRISNMTRAVLTKKLIPLKELTENFPREYRYATLAYDQSFYLVSYLLSKKGRKTFHQFIREYGKGKQLERVLFETYGVSLVELEEEWIAHLKLRFSWLPLAFSTTTIWFVITMIFLVSYWRKRRDNYLKQAEWEEEDSEF
jgi:hypothetical protein